MPSAPTCRAEPERGQTLAELRRQRGLSQVALAGRLGVSQPHIAQVENQRDMLLATLRRQIAALGGELELVAHFPDGSVTLDLTNDTPQNTHTIHQHTSGRTAC